MLQSREIIEVLIRELSEVQTELPGTEAQPSVELMLASSPRLMTMIYVIKSKSKQVLLGHKARGFGAGHWNAFGGKVECDIDNSIPESAARELQEECGLVVAPESLVHAGLLWFRYPSQAKPKEWLEVHVFIVDLDVVPNELISGAPSESEEMNPIDWFSFGDVPLDKMWSDDKYWLPRLLHGFREDCQFRFVGFFQFVEMSEIRYYTLITSSNQIDVGAIGHCVVSPASLLDGMLKQSLTRYAQTRSFLNH